MNAPLNSDGGKASPLTRRDFLWRAGAGINAGVSHGRSDDLGYRAAEGKTYCYDLHDTILHLLGIDHTQLTLRHTGIDRRLTDVHGKVIQDILA